MRLLKHSRADDIDRRLPEIFQLFDEITSKQMALEVLYSALRYLSNSSESLTKEQLTNVVEAVFEEGGDTMTTIAQQLRLEGRMEGEAIGLAKAKKAEQRAKQNEQKAWQLALKTVRQTLVIRFDTKLEQYDKLLKELDLPALEKLSDLVFEIPTLTEFETALTKLEKPPETDAPPPDQTQLDSES